MNKKTLYKIIDLIKRQRDQYPLWQRLYRYIYLKFFHNEKPKYPKQETVDKIHNETNIIITKNSISPAENKWITFKNSIKNRLLKDNINGFIFWPEILYNMHYTPNITELKYLKKSPLWEKYKEALKIKSFKIKQIPFFAYSDSNENSIRQAFSLENFLQNTNINLDQIDQIFEFGGGYGSMCLIIKRLGFKGRYIIFDWPELSIIQKYYLDSEQVIDNNIQFINELSQIELLPKPAKTLIIATWSLSECSFELRDQIINIINPDYMLLAYQKSFGGLKNEDYFDKLQNRLKNFSWKKINFSYIPSQENKYLFGIIK